MLFRSVSQSRYGFVGCVISTIGLIGAVAFSMPSGIFIAEKGFYLGGAMMGIGFIVAGATIVAGELNLIG